MVVATLWALGASLYIALMPVSVQGVRDVLLRDSGKVVEAFIREQPWYEAHAPWGVLWLVFFCGFYLLAAWVAWRGNYLTLAIMSATGLALSIITGFSIGSAYLPAALGLFVGALIFLSSRLLSTRC